MKKFYQQIASTLDARKRCEERGNEEWEQKHQETLDALMGYAPSGSGIDKGIDLLEGQCGPEKLVFSSDYHHMNEHGMYCGWTSHQVSVSPSFHGFSLKVSGRNHNEIKDYLHDVFATWLDQEVPAHVLNMHVAKV